MAHPFTSRADGLVVEAKRGKYEDLRLRYDAQERAKSEASNSTLARRQLWIATVVGVCVVVQALFAYLQYMKPDHVPPTVTCPSCPACPAAPACPPPVVNLQPNMPTKGSK